MLRPYRSTTLRLLQKMAHRADKADGIFIHRHMPTAWQDSHLRTGNTLLKLFSIHHRRQTIRLSPYNQGLGCDTMETFFQSLIRDGQRNLPAVERCCMRSRYACKPDFTHVSITEGSRRLSDRRSITDWEAEGFVPEADLPVRFSLLRWKLGRKAKQAPTFRSRRPCLRQLSVDACR